LFISREAEKALPYAKNNHERANIYALRALNYVGRALPDIRRILALDCKNPLLNTLMIREINKLEDWLLTAKYTDFGPTVTLDWSYSSSEKHETVQARNYRKDRHYVHELRQFLAQTSARRVANPALWHLMQAYLAFIDEDFAGSSAYLGRALRSRGLNGRIEAQARLTRIMVELHPRNHRPADHDRWLLAELKWLETHQDQVYMFRKTYNRLMMALTHRYQQAGNMVRATLCHSKIIDYVRDDPYYKESPKDNWEGYHEDAGKKINAGMNFYSSYLFFLGEQASIGDMEQLLAFLGQKRKSPLEQYLARELIKDQDRIWDLLGGKYLQTNDLAKARAAFAKVNPDF
jgi:hypothetical protein